MSASTGRKPIPEQHAQHTYQRHAVPARASARPAPDTEEPGASHHHAGHYAGMHPEDTPRTTVSRALASRRAYPPIEDDVYEDEEDEVYTTPARSASSARRYGPARSRSTGPRGRPPKRGLAFLAGSCVIAGITLALFIPPLWTRAMDQLHYGFPRTYQVDANVRHGTRNDPDTHFIALNNHGAIEVIEMPIGTIDPAKLHLYLVARLHGADADQVPVTIEFEDVNGDGEVDMLVMCNNNEYILYNHGQSFQEKP